jgi:hypothetical protein
VHYSKSEESRKLNSSVCATRPLHSCFLDLARSMHCDEGPSLRVLAGLSCGYCCRGSSLNYWQYSAKKLSTFRFLFLIFLLLKQFSFLLGPLCTVTFVFLISVCYYQNYWLHHLDNWAFSAWHFRLCTV